ncbi:MAG TPA: CoA ester lyase [Gemmatimonadaceae bacterium]|jgi:citrate lyase subunit beta/citryl-CoA lyase
MPTKMQRSMLFVPAVKWALIPKAAASEADAVCVDLEDSVPASEKQTSRHNVVRAFAELDFGSRVRMMRMNGLDTPYAYRDLIDIVEKVGDRIDLVMVPKVNSPRDVTFVSTLLTQIEMSRGLTRQVGLAVQIETAAGYLNIREIARASSRIEWLIFGQGDFAASMRMPATDIGTMDEHDRIYPGHRWHNVMTTIVAAARANGLVCLDGPYAAFNDKPGFEHACQIARALGFDGKQCIHPSQIAGANAAFSPTSAEAEYAQRVVAAYDAAVASGRGAVQLDGKMVDEANVRMARVILDQLAMMQRSKQ